MRRVNESLRQVLSESVGSLADPRLGFVTVTGVECTPDLDHARVYVQVLGSEQRREKGLSALESARGALQERIGREVRMRRVPRLIFVYDESLDRGMRINALLAEHTPMVQEPEDEAAAEPTGHGDEGEPE
jgi:ribosome-binding factor A